MRYVCEFEGAPKPCAERAGWWRLVAIEPRGLRHELTGWRAAPTERAARRIARREGAAFVRVH